MESKRLRIFIAVFFIAVALLANSGWLDQQGYRYTQSGLQRALVTFGVSRTLNGVISVAQGTEVAVEPVGIGMTFTPGQILDPVNDLIERFSTVVLVAGTAFGAQHVLLDVTASALFAWCFFSLTVIALVCLLFWPRLNATFRRAVMRAALTLAFLRFVIPAFAVAGELFYQQFLEPQYRQSSEELTLTTERLNLLNDESAVGVNSSDDKSLLESAKEWVQGAGSALDWKAQLAEFSKVAEAVSEHAIKLMVVFVFQTLLLPLLAMWVTYRLSWLCLAQRY